MDVPELEKESYALIQKDFDIDDTFISQDLKLENFLHVLESTIRSMLDRDFNGLLNIVYRIDLPESQLKQILEYSKPDQISKELAIAIFERQKQKVISRNKYKE